MASPNGGEIRSPESVRLGFIETKTLYDEDVPAAPVVLREAREAREPGSPAGADAPAAAPMPEPPRPSYGAANLPEVPPAIEALMNQISSTRPMNRPIRRKEAVASQRKYAPLLAHLGALLRLNDRQRANLLRLLGLMDIPPANQEGPRWRYETVLRLHKCTAVEREGYLDALVSLGGPAEDARGVEWLLDLQRPSFKFSVPLLALSDLHVELCSLLYLESEEVMVDDLDPTASRALENAFQQLNGTNLPIGHNAAAFEKMQRLHELLSLTLEQAAVCAIITKKAAKLVNAPTTEAIIAMLGERNWNDKCGKLAAFLQTITENTVAGLRDHADAMWNAMCDVEDLLVEAPIPLLQQLFERLIHAQPWLGEGKLDQNKVDRYLERLHAGELYSLRRQLNAAVAILQQLLTVNPFAYVDQVQQDKLRDSLLRRLHGAREERVVCFVHCCKGHTLQSPEATTCTCAEFTAPVFVDESSPIVYQSFPVGDSAMRLIEIGVRLDMLFKVDPSIALVVCDRSDTDPACKPLEQLLDFGARSQFDAKAMYDCELLNQLSVRVGGANVVVHLLTGTMTIKEASPHIRLIPVKPVFTSLCINDVSVPYVRVVAGVTQAPADVPLVSEMEGKYSERPMPLPDTGAVLAGLIAATISRSRPPPQTPDTTLAIEAATLYALLMASSEALNARAVQDFLKKQSERTTRMVLEAGNVRLSISSHVVSLLTGKHSVFCVSSEISDSIQELLNKLSIPVQHISVARNNATNVRTIVHELARADSRTYLMLTLGGSVYPEDIKNIIDTAINGSCRVVFNAPASSQAFVTLIRLVDAPGTREHVSIIGVATSTTSKGRIDKLASDIARHQADTLRGAEAYIRNPDDAAANAALLRVQESCDECLNVPDIPMLPSLPKYSVAVVEDAPALLAAYSDVQIVDGRHPPKDSLRGFALVTATEGLAVTQVASIVDQFSVGGCIVEAQMMGNEISLPVRSALPSDPVIVLHWATRKELEAAVRNSRRLTIDGLPVIRALRILFGSFFSMSLLPEGDLTSDEEIQRLTDGLYRATGGMLPRDEVVLRAVQAVCRPPARMAAPSFDTGSYFQCVLDLVLWYVQQTARADITDWTLSRLLAFAPHLHFAPQLTRVASLCYLLYHRCPGAVPQPLKWFLPRVLTRINSVTTDHLLSFAAQEDSNHAFEHVNQLTLVTWANLGMRKAPAALDWNRVQADQFNLENKERLVRAGLCNVTVLWPLLCQIDPDRLGRLLLCLDSQSGTDRALLDCFATLLQSQVLRKWIAQEPENSPLRGIVAILKWVLLLYPLEDVVPATLTAIDLKHLLGMQIPLKPPLNPDSLARALVELDSDAAYLDLSMQSLLLNMMLKDEVVAIYLPSRDAPIEADPMLAALAAELILTAVQQAYGTPHRTTFMNHPLVQHLAQWMLTSHKHHMLCAPDCLAANQPAQLNRIGVATLASHANFLADFATVVGTGAGHVLAHFRRFTPAAVWRMVLRSSTQQQTQWLAHLWVASIADRQAMVRSVDSLVRFGLTAQQLGGSLEPVMCFFDALHRTLLEKGVDGGIFPFLQRVTVTDAVPTFVLTSMNMLVNPDAVPVRYFAHGPRSFSMFLVPFLVDAVVTRWSDARVGPAPPLAVFDDLLECLDASSTPLLCRHLLQLRAAQRQDFDKQWLTCYCWMLSPFWSCRPNRAQIAWIRACLFEQPRGRVQDAFFTAVTNHPQLISNEAQYLTSPGSMSDEAYLTLSGIFGDPLQQATFLVAHQGDAFAAYFISLHYRPLHPDIIATLDAQVTAALTARFPITTGQYHPIVVTTGATKDTILQNLKIFKSFQDRNVAGIKDVKFLSGTIIYLMRCAYAWFRCNGFQDTHITNWLKLIGNQNLVDATFGRPHLLSNSPNPQDLSALALPLPLYCDTSPSNPASLQLFGDRPDDAAYTLQMLETTLPVTIAERPNPPLPEALVTTSADGTMWQRSQIYTAIPMEYAMILGRHVAQIAVQCVQAPANRPPSQEDLRGLAGFMLRLINQPLRNEAEQKAECEQLMVDMCAAYADGILQVITPEQQKEAAMCHRAVGDAMGIDPHRRTQQVHSAIIAAFASRNLGIAKQTFQEFAWYNARPHLVDHKVDLRPLDSKQHLVIALKVADLAGFESLTYSSINAFIAAAPIPPNQRVVADGIERKELEPVGPPAPRAIRRSASVAAEEAVVDRRGNCLELRQAVAGHGIAGGDTNYEALAQTYQTAHELQRPVTVVVDDVLHLLPVAGAVGPRADRRGPAVVAVRVESAAFAREDDCVFMVSGSRPNIASWVLDQLQVPADSRKQVVVSPHAVYTSASHAQLYLSNLPPLSRLVLLQSGLLMHKTETLQWLPALARYLAAGELGRPWDLLSISHWLGAKIPEDIVSPLLQFIRAEFGAQLQAAGVGESQVLEFAAHLPGSAGLFERLSAAVYNGEHGFRRSQASQLILSAHVDHGAAGITQLDVAQDSWRGLWWLGRALLSNKTNEAVNALRTQVAVPAVIEQKVASRRARILRSLGAAEEQKGQDIRSEGVAEAKGPEEEQAVHRLSVASVCGKVVADMEWLPRAELIPSQDWGYLVHRSLPARLNAWVSTVMASELPIELKRHVVKTCMNPDHRAFSLFKDRAGTELAYTPDQVALLQLLRATCPSAKVAKTLGESLAGAMTEDQLAELRRRDNKFGMRVLPSSAHIDLHLRSLGFSCGVVDFGNRDKFSEHITPPQMLSAILAECSQQPQTVFWVLRHAGNRIKDGLFKQLAEETMSVPWLFFIIEDMDSSVLFPENRDRIVPVDVDERGDTELRTNEKHYTSRWPRMSRDVHTVRTRLRPAWRDELLAKLRGPPCKVLVVGAPGIGKSHFCREADGGLAKWIQANWANSIIVPIDGSSKLFNQYTVPYVLEHHLAKHQWTPASNAKVLLIVDEWHFVDEGVKQQVLNTMKEQRYEAMYLLLLSNRIMDGDNNIENCDPIMAAGNLGIELQFAFGKAVKRFDADPQAANPVQSVAWVYLFVRAMSLLIGQDVMSLRMVDNMLLALDALQNGEPTAMADVLRSKHGITPMSTAKTMVSELHRLSVTAEWRSAMEDTIRVGLVDQSEAGWDLLAAALHAKVSTLAAEALSHGETHPIRYLLLGALVAPMDAAAFPEFDGIPMACNVHIRDQLSGWLVYTRAAAAASSGDGGMPAMPAIPPANAMMRREVSIGTTATATSFESAGGPAVGGTLGDPQLDDWFRAARQVIGQLNLVDVPRSLPQIFTFGTTQFNYARVLLMPSNAYTSLKPVAEFAESGHSLDFAPFVDMLVQPHNLDVQYFTRLLRSYRPLLQDLMESQFADRVMAVLCQLLRLDSSTSASLDADREPQSLAEWYRSVLPLPEDPMELIEQEFSPQMAARWRLYRFAPIDQLRRLMRVTDFAVRRELLATLCWAGANGMLDLQAGGESEADRAMRDRILQLHLIALSRELFNTEKVAAAEKLCRLWSARFVRLMPEAGHVIDSSIIADSLAQYGFTSPEAVQLPYDVMMVMCTKLLDVRPDAPLSLRCLYQLYSGADAPATTRRLVQDEQFWAAEMLESEPRWMLHLFNQDFKDVGAQAAILGRLRGDLKAVAGEIAVRYEDALLTIENFDAGVSVGGELRVQLAKIHQRVWRK